MYLKKLDLYVIYLEFHSIALHIIYVIPLQNVEESSIINMVESMGYQYGNTIVLQTCSDHVTQRKMFSAIIIPIMTTSHFLRYDSVTM